MPSIIFYATGVDAEILRHRINEDPAVAWIVKVGESNHRYTWRAMRAIDRLEQSSYAVWHIDTFRPTVPSRDRSIPDFFVPDPFAGWTQMLTYAGAQAPWFGGNLPGPFTLTINEAGRERPNALGRSFFGGASDHFAMIGNPAPESAKRWCSAMRRFIVARTTALAWPIGSGGRSRCYVFPDALTQLRAGRHFDSNP